MKCEVCGTEYGKGEGFHGTKYKAVHFCCQDCYDRFIKMKSAPKPTINYKPQKGSDRRKFTDYVQMLTENKANWQWLMKQAKDIQDEYEIDWQTMYRTLKYAHEYEDAEWKMEYGLYQFFPKYIKPMQEFTEAIMSAKQIENTEDEINYVRRPKQYIGKVEF